MFMALMASTIEAKGKKSQWAEVVGESSPEGVA